MLLVPYIVATEVSCQVLRMIRVPGCTTIPTKLIRGLALRAPLHAADVQELNDIIDRPTVLCRLVEEGKEAAAEKWLEGLTRADQVGAIPVLAMSG